MYLKNKLYIFIVLILPFWSIGQTNHNYLLHKVNPTDRSLWRLAQQYSTSVAAIQKINQLKGTIIKPNQILKIPIGEFRSHVVSSSDKSLWQISRHYQLPVDSIRKYNSIVNDVIKEGDTLLLPTKLLVPQVIIDQKTTVFKNKKEDYKLVVDILLHMHSSRRKSNTVNIQLYQKREAKWEIVDRMYHLELYDEDYVFLSDFDKNKIPDIRILNYVGARHYYIFYSLVVIDFLKHKLRKIKDFEERAAPEYDIEAQGIRTSYFSSETGGEAKSKYIYQIDYKNYSLKKVKN